MLPSPPDKAAVREAIFALTDPVSGAEFSTLASIDGMRLDGTRAIVTLSVPADRAEALEPLRKLVETTLGQLPGISSALVVLTGQLSGNNDANPGVSAGQSRPSAPGKPENSTLNTIGSVIAIASGKGGVGKSTLTTNLALAVSLEGKRVGILDADIHGPSQPRMLGASGKPTTDDGHTIEPMRAYGIPVMSMGFLVPEDSAIVWRGPMVQKALSQMMHQVAWGNLDILFIDLPPGTGDVQITLAQQAGFAGAIVVSTPQDIALIDARKGIDLFGKVDVPIFGIVENMSGYRCPNCGETSSPFGSGGAKREAEKLNIPFLGVVPLDIAVRETSDTGRPIVVSDTSNPASGAFQSIAQALVRRLDQ